MATILLLLPNRTYRSAAFLTAARRLALDVVVGTEGPSVFAHALPETMLGLDFGRPDRAVQQVRELARRRAIDAVVGVDDATAVLASHIAASLGLPHTPVSAATCAREKHLSRQALARDDVRVPRFALRALADDPGKLAGEAAFPCVVKPLALSGSRGVMRADDRRGLARAMGRLDAIMSAPDLAGQGDTSRHLLIEDFVPGAEVALEGLLVDGALHVLALFDKPDPLDGPFFEETIYVTPSRLPAPIRECIIAQTARAAAAMGLARGPIHAELRVAPAGPVVIELAARSIGGLCSRTLRFATGATLEELILGAALGRPIAPPRSDPGAAGVMMIPVPGRGVLKEVRGVDRAREVPWIEDVAITTHPGQSLVPLPEGSSYPGFIFARAPTPAQVESALRAAHRCLEFVFECAPSAPAVAHPAGFCGSGS